MRRIDAIQCITGGSSSTTFTIVALARISLISIHPLGSGRTLTYRGARSRCLPFCLFDLREKIGISIGSTFTGGLARHRSAGFLKSDFFSVGRWSVCINLSLAYPVTLLARSENIISELCTWQSRPSRTKTGVSPSYFSNRDNGIPNASANRRIILIRGSWPRKNWETDFRADSSG